MFIPDDTQHELIKACIQQSIQKSYGVQNIFAVWTQNARDDGQTIIGGHYADGNRKHLAVALITCIREHYDEKERAEIAKWIVSPTSRTPTERELQ